MKKLFLAVLALFTVDMMPLVAMDPSSDVATHSLGIIQDINELKPYYQAIQQILVALNVVMKSGNSSIRFEALPYSYRTPKYLFLETDLYPNDGNDYDEKLVRLYTPFGEVKLLSGEWLNRAIQVSQDFLASMNWTLEDVTEKVKIYKYIQKDDLRYGPYTFKKESWKGAGDQVKLYLIKTVNFINFFENDAQEELVIFLSLSLEDGQYEKDKAQFSELLKQ